MREEDRPTIPEIEDSFERIAALSQNLALAAPDVLVKMCGDDAKEVNPAEAAAACTLAAVLITKQFCPEQDLPGAISALLKVFADFFSLADFEEAQKILGGLQTPCDPEAVN